MGHFTGVIALIILFTALIWFTTGWWISGIERAKQQRKRETQWNHQLNTLRRDRDAFRDEVEIAHGKIRVLDNRRADGNSPPRSPEEELASKEMTARLQSHLEQARQQISGFARKVDSLREQSIEREDVLEQLKKKLTDTSRTLHDREQKLAALVGQETPKVQTVAQISEPVSDERIARYEGAIQQLRIEAQTQADAAEQDRQRLDHTISEHMQTIGALRSELAQRDARVADTDNGDSELVVVRREFEALEQENQQLVAKIEQLSQGSMVVEHQRSRLRTLQADYDEQRLVLEELARTVDVHEQQRTEYTDLQAQYRDQQSTVEQLTAACAQMEAQRDQANLQLESLQDEADNQNAMESADQNGELNNTIEQQALTISSLHQQAITREHEFESELLEMRAAMETQEQIVSQLRDVLSKPTQVVRPAPRPVATSHILPPQSGDLFAQVDYPAALPAPPSMHLHKQVPATADDLKKINGIGPAFERALNNLGLFEYEQIAAFTEGDIEWVAQALRSFPDRIVKGEWIEQAQQLIARRSAASE